MINPTEIFVTNQRVIRYKHEFFGRGVLEDVQYSGCKYTSKKRDILI